MNPNKISFVEIIGEVFIKEKLNLFIYCLVVCACSVVSDLDCSLSGSFVQGVSQAEYWSGLPFPPPGDLPDPGIEPTSPADQLDSLPLSHLGSPYLLLGNIFKV